MACRQAFPLYLRDECAGGQIRSTGNRHSWYAQRGAGRDPWPRRGFNGHGLELPPGRGTHHPPKTEIETFQIGKIPLAEGRILHCFNQLAMDPCQVESRKKRDDSLRGHLVAHAKARKDQCGKILVRNTITRETTGNLRQYHLNRVYGRIIHAKNCLLDLEKFPVLQVIH
jgi:hypothetical protein